MIPATTTARRARKSSSFGERFVWGGVSYEILSDFGEWELGEEHKRFLVGGPAIAEVRVSVSGDPTAGQPPEGQRDVSWRWIEDRAEVRTRDVSVALRRLGPGRYAASARVSPSSFAMSSLITAITGAIAHREGGLVLHSAGVVLDDQAVLFIGPSGAGKTTAAHHAHGTSWCAKDRSVVAPSSRGWTTWGMAGGDEIDLPRASRVGHSVGAILRVVRGAGEVQVKKLPGPGAFRALRESAQASGPDVAAELALHDTIAHLADSVFVGTIELPLGANITDALRARLSEGSC